ncbi:MAG: YfhO family protein [Chloroflexota bacterium]
MGGLDVLDYFYPYRAYAGQAIRSGRLPLWNDQVFGGVPFLANIQTALFYPFSALFYVLSEPTAYTWSVLLHVFLGGLFTYAFARQSLSLDAPPAFVAALVFAFGGFLGGQLGHINQVSAAIWLPLLLLCWDKASRGRLLFVVLAAMVVAVQFLAGHTQESYLILVGLLLYAGFQTALAWRGLGWIVLPVNGLAFLVVVALGGGLAAVQLIPTTELTLWSIRSGGLPYTAVTSFSLKGSMLFNALFPPFFNRGLLLQPGGSEFLGYGGMLALVLALVAVIYRPRDRHTLFFAGLAAVTLFLALGKQNPLFPLLYRIVPGFNLFRVPARWLFLYCFSVAILAGLGAQTILVRKDKLSLPVRRFAMAIAVCVLVVLALARTQALPPRGTLLAWGLFAVIALVATTAGLIRPTAALGPLFIAVLVVELFLAAQSLDYNQPVLSRVFRQPIPTIDFLQHQPGPYRAVSVAQDSFVPAIEPAFRQKYSSRLSSEQVLDYLSYYKLREILEPNTSMPVHIPTIDGYDGGLLPLARYAHFKNALTGSRTSPDTRIRFALKWLPKRRLLDLAGVRYVVMDNLADKTAGGVKYDLSSFIHLSAKRPQAKLRLSQPAVASSVGIVSASPTGVTGRVATLTLTSPSGEKQTLTVLAGDGQPMGTLPYSQPLPTRLLTDRLQQPLEVQSISVSLDDPRASFFLNGVALMDGGGKAVSPLVAPGPQMPQVFQGDVKIFRNDAALPRAFLVHRASAALTPEQALAGIRNPTFQPNSSAVIEANPAPPAGHSLIQRVTSRLDGLLSPPASSGTIRPSWRSAQPAAPGTPPDSVQVYLRSPERIDVTTTSATAGFLIVTNSYFPGWQVTVDGRPQRLYAADYLFQGVHLGAGAHRVELTYEPRSLTLGEIVSSVAAFVCLVGLALSPIGRGRRPGLR